MTEKKEAGKKMGSWLPEDTQEHLKAAREARMESLRSFLPPEFFENQKKARKEMLLAARSMIDHAIERIEA
jgi:hypothetical protein